MGISLLAMHMANELLSVPVAAASLALAAAAVVLSARWARRAAAAERLPLMGVMGAFVFAAQMINFTLPGMPGTSGHLGGGVLLAILLGPAAGIVAMAGILLVQCLLFQDGGLLALGCNILNMGVIPCLLGWCLYRVVLGPAQRASAGRQYVAAWIACLGGVAAGAGMVPIEAAASGVLRVPLRQFLGVMLGVHLLVGLCEGAITFAVIAYMRRTRPELVGLVPTEVPNQRGAAADRPGYASVTASLLVTALLLAGLLSWFASTRPDGLEWSCGQRPDVAVESVIHNDSPTVAAVEQWQNRWAPMADYTKRDEPLGRLPAAKPPEAAAPWPNPNGWRSLAGLLGTCVTLGMVYGASRWMRRKGLGIGD
jgi:cobalt/nickel transport system permease protein